MSLFKSLFGKRDPIAEIDKLHARGEWAALLSAIRGLDRQALAEADLLRFDGWAAEAGDRLAGLNLAEGEGALRLGNRIKAREHLQLAREQARGPELLGRIERLLSEVEGAPAAGPAPAAASAHACGGGCGPTCAPAASAEAEGELAVEERLELLLATLPAALAAGYAAAGETFLQGWLAAQEGDDRQALKLFATVPAGERGPLWQAEYGAALARAGRAAEAENCLRAALAAMPGLFSAFDALVSLLAVSGRQADLDALLRRSLEEGRFTGYCWSRIAQLEGRRGNLAGAAAACDAALAAGEADPATLALCAALQEQGGDLPAAEKLLSRLPAGGCGGGAHPLLAEFWLRRGSNLDRALESFKGALRSEQDNPRWALRIAQVYLAKGWKREAAKQVESLLGRGDIPEALGDELRSVAQAVR